MGVGAQPGEHPSPERSAWATHSTPGPRHPAWWVAAVPAARVAGETSGCQTKAPAGHLVGVDVSMTAGGDATGKWARGEVGWGAVWGVTKATPTLGDTAGWWKSWPGWAEASLGGAAGQRAIVLLEAASGMAASYRPPRVPQPRAQPRPGGQAAGDSPSSRSALGRVGPGAFGAWTQGWVLSWALGAPAQRHLPALVSLALVCISLQPRAPRAQLMASGGANTWGKCGWVLVDTRQPHMGTLGQPPWGQCSP